jgi:cation:H+ antiporter
LCVVVFQDGQISQIDAGLFVLVYIAFTAYLIRLVRQQVTATENRGLREEVKELSPGGNHSGVWLSLSLLALGTALLGAGAQATVTGASQLARQLGWSERLIGLTIVSCGTGLPEVVASLVSSIRGRSDVAIGNVIGSNLFNILVILGLSGLFAPLPVSPDLLRWDCWWMLGATVILLPILLNGRGVERWEGGVLIAIYAAYLGLLLKSP